MKVKLKRNVFVTGKWYQAGEVANLKACDAEALVEMGKAQKVGILENLKRMVTPEK